jgi:hypothetical protein
MKIISRAESLAKWHVFYNDLLRLREDKGYGTTKTKGQPKRKPKAERGLPPDVESGLRPAGSKRHAKRLVHK